MRFSFFPIFCFNSPKVPMKNVCPNRRSFHGAWPMAGTIRSDGTWDILFNYATQLDLPLLLFSSHCFVYILCSFFFYEFRILLLYFFLHFPIGWTFVSPQASGLTVGSQRFAYWIWRWNNWKSVPELKSTRMLNPMHRGMNCKMSRWRYESKEASSSVNKAELLRGILKEPNLSLKLNAEKFVIENTFLNILFWLNFLKSK